MYLESMGTHSSFPQRYIQHPKYLKTLYSWLIPEGHPVVDTKASQPHESKYVMVRTLPSPNLCKMINESVYIQWNSGSNLYICISIYNICVPYRNRQVSILRFHWWASFVVLHHGVVSCDDGSTKDLLIVETKTTWHFLDEDHLHSFPGIGTNQCSEN